MQSIVWELNWFWGSNWKSQSSIVANACQSTYIANAYRSVKTVQNVRVVTIQLCWIKSDSRHIKIHASTCWILTGANTFTIPCEQQYVFAAKFSSMFCCCFFYATAISKSSTLWLCVGAREASKWMRWEWKWKKIWKKKNQRYCELISYSFSYDWMLFTNKTEAMFSVYFFFFILPFRCLLGFEFLFLHSKYCICILSVSLVLNHSCARGFVFVFISFVYTFQ